MVVCIMCFADNKAYTYYSWCVGTFNNRQQMLESMFIYCNFLKEKLGWKYPRTYMIT